MSNNQEYTFFMKEKDYVDMRNRLTERGIKQVAPLMRFFVSKIIEKDENMEALLDEYAGERNIRAPVADKLKTQEKKGNDILEKLGITESDLDKIFDEYE